MTVPHPGTSELGWLADLKEVAEQSGQIVYGEPIRWDVEVIQKAGRKRPDVVIRRDRDGSVLASGEAKRPDTPAGLHPLVASEIQDALEKAGRLGAPVCFTTNFLEAAVFNATNRGHGTALDRLQGRLIPIVPESLARAPSWWSALTTGERNAQVILGLRQLFERIKAASGKDLPHDINEVTLLVFSRVTDRLVQPLYEALLHERNAGKLTQEIATHALRVHLRPQEDEQLRFLVAQGIAEVLTAVLFYRNIADHFSLGPFLAGTSPKTANAFLVRLKKSLEQAIAVSGDYETIFELSPIADYVLANGGAPALQHWKDLIGFVDQLDFTAVTSDVIGSIFERLISPERRYAMGQHYTNARVARSMSRWALRNESDIVADMACGAGTFLVELHGLLSSRGQSHETILRQLLGNDIDPFAVHLASVNLVTREIYRGANYPAIRLGDAFDIDPGSTLLNVRPSAGGQVHVEWPSTRLDAVVGNPPYAEKPHDVSRLKARLAQLGKPAPSVLSGGNLAAWFFLLAAASIKPNGVIALVMPSGVLQNSNLEPWRLWLRRHFDVTVWHCEDDVWFSDARVATCVLLASARSGNASFGKLYFVDVRERVDGNLETINGIASPVANASIRDISSLTATEDILVAGTCPHLLGQFETSSAVTTLNALSNVAIFSGNKLGHAFFQLRDLVPTRKSILRKVEGLKLEFEISRTHLTPLLSSPKDERTGEFRGSEFWVLDAPETIPSSGPLRRYIEHGRALHVPSRPSIEQRGKSWWSADWRRSQIAVQIHPGFLHQVWWSAEPFVAKNNFHVLVFDDNVSEIDRELVAASLASGWGALSALFISSEVGCEGVRWLSTTQFGKWPVLIPGQVTNARRAQVLRTYRLFRQLEAREIPAMEATAIAVWLQLTEDVAQAAGMSDPANAAAQCLEIARQTCVRRTHREAMALAGRMGKGGSGTANLAKHVHALLETTPLAGVCLADLTGGQRQVRLRSASELAQGAFDFGDGKLALPGEISLANILGTAFECAPLFRLDDPESLARMVEELLGGITCGIAGERPGKQDTALNTYNEIAADIRRLAIQWLQREVRKRLS
jgi:hypothetical protein